MTHVSPFAAPRQRVKLDPGRCRLGGRGGRPEMVERKKGGGVELNWESGAGRCCQHALPGFADAELHVWPGEEHNVYGSDGEEAQMQRQEEAKEIMAKESDPQRQAMRDAILLLISIRAEKGAICADSKSVTDNHVSL